MTRKSKSEILDIYEELESRVTVETHLNSVTYSAPVNFNESMKSPRHRWYPYKEGFSPSFVRSFLHRYVNGNHATVLDPFSGVGTAVLEAGFSDMLGMGVEVSPLADFVARTKAIILNANELSDFERTIHCFMRAPLVRIAEPPENDTVLSYFEKPYLEAILRIKAFISGLQEEKIKDLFALALLSNIEVYSTHRKAGNGLKKKKKLSYRKYPGSPLDQVRNSIHLHLRMFRSDLERINDFVKPVFLRANVLELSPDQYPYQFDCLLTSPPYANCFDYSKIYSCELWMGGFFQSKKDQQTFRMNSVRSHVHATWPERYEDMGSTTINNVIYPVLSSKDLWSRRIPDMLRGYFMDLGNLLHLVRPVLHNGAALGFVVSNSAYGGIPVATDLLLVETAIRHGYKAERLEIYRQIIPSSQQYVKMIKKELMRESLVILRKE